MDRTLRGHSTTDSRVLREGFSQAWGGREPEGKTQALVVLGRGMVILVPQWNIREAAKANMGR